MNNPRFQPKNNAFLPKSSMTGIKKRADKLPQAVNRYIVSAMV
jgi:hypothetical protein